MRRSFEHPKHMFKLMDKKIITILSKMFCLTGPMLYNFSDSHTTVKDLYSDVLQLEGLALDVIAQNLYWTSYLVCLGPVIGYFF